MEPFKNQLILCSESIDDSERLRTFGSLYTKSCSIDLSKYLSRDYKMYFYELFLFNPITNDLIDVPIMIENVPNPKYTSEGNNFFNGNNSPENWILTRRFFLIDNLSGLQTLNSFKSMNDKPIAIRFPKVIKLIVLLQNSSEAKIMLPYFEIIYSSKLSSLLDNFPNVTVKIISDYKMDITTFKNTMFGIFIALTFIVLLIALIKMYIWFKLNPPQINPVIDYIYSYLLSFINFIKFFVY
jgi:hypothetical protein